MSNDLTKNQKLLVGLGVLIITGFTINGKFFSSSNNSQTTSSAQDELSKVLVEGDADSPVDTIRRLKETARKAVKAAQDAQQDAEQYKVTTGQRLDELMNAIAADKERTNQKFDASFSDIKSELGNFKELVTGQLQSTAKQNTQRAGFVPAKARTQIGPVNLLPESALEAAAESSLNGRANDRYAIGDGFLLSNASAQVADSEDHLTAPVATIPENSPLLHSVTLSTLIGRVPKRGQVFEPFNFYIQTGADNWTSQDHQIPFLERAIWRGIATGDKDLECVRGALVSVTFVFTDETIQTVTGTKDEPLAELVTTTGSNCVPGKYVSNTGKYLAAYGLGGALAGLGQGIAGSETLTSLTEGGRIITAVNGNTGNFLAGRALSASANKAAELIDEEYESSFASVILQAGVDINLMALKQINIDHNAEGRKVSYLSPQEN